MVFSFGQHRPTQAFIHLEHLKENLSLLRKLLSPDDFFCPMVKANAYGHGDVEVTKLLESHGVQQVGVGLLEEGLLLRGMGCQLRILFFGMFDKVGAKACVEGNMIPVVSDWSQFESLEPICRSLGKRIKVHVKFDTGMSRLGFEPAQAQKIADYLQGHAFFELEGVLTHLSHGEDIEIANGNSQKQIQDFENLVRLFQDFNPVVHSLNSAGLIGRSRLAERRGPPWRYKHGARPGLALYGVDPLGSDLGLRPVMSLRSQIQKVKWIEKGQGVSYGHSWKADRKTLIGVVPIGYADGYHRSLSNKAQVLVKGQRVQQRGQVCMDYLMVDLTDLPGTSDPASFLWNTVTLFGYDEDGQQLPVQELARQAGTIPWELLTSISERVPRITPSQKAQP